MYETALVLHSLLRWAIVLFGVYAVARALSGLAGKKAWTPADVTAGRLFVIALDTQFLLGVLLYGILSPLVTAAMTDVGAAMKTPALRYWLVEHPLPMLVALGLAHLGFARAKRSNSTLSHRQVLVHFAVALLLIGASTPWPFMANARPWMRFW